MSKCLSRNIVQTKFTLFGNIVQTSKNLCTILLNFNIPGWGAVYSWDTQNRTDLIVNKGNLVNTFIFIVVSSPSTETHSEYKQVLENFINKLLLNSKSSNHDFILIWCKAMFNFVKIRLNAHLDNHLLVGQHSCCSG